MKIFGKEIKISTLLGLAFYGLGIYRIIDTSFFLKSSISTTAIVREFSSTPITLPRESRFGSQLITTNMLTPVVIFKDLSGQEHQVFEIGFFSTFEIGKEVSILYKPSNPEESYVDSFGALWGPCVLLFSFASLVFFFRILALLRSNTTLHRSPRTPKRC